jgi:threonine/homoserine/homoserine lactone efflux protein
MSLVNPKTVIDFIHQPSGTLAAADLCGGHSLTVTVFAWVIAFAIGSVGTLYNRIRSFELWFRRASAVLLVITGIYLAVAT